MELYLTLNTEERQLLGQQYPQEKQRMNQLTARWYEEGRLDGQLKTLIRLLTSAHWTKPPKPGCRALRRANWIAGPTAS